MIGIWLLFRFRRLFDHSPDCLSTRWKVGLIAPPIVYSPQKCLRDSHLKGAILGTSFGAAALPIFGHPSILCIDI